MNLNAQSAKENGVKLDQEWMIKRKLMYLLTEPFLHHINIPKILKNHFFFLLMLPTDQLLQEVIRLNQEKVNGLIILTISEYGLTMEM